MFYSFGISLFGNVTHCIVKMNSAQLFDFIRDVKFTYFNVLSFFTVYFIFTATHLSLTTTRQ